MYDDYQDNEEESEDINPYDPFGLFGSGIFSTPPTNYSDIFSIGFGNHLADCFFFSFGDFPASKINKEDSYDIQKLAKDIVNSIFGPQKAQYWKDYIFICDKLGVQYKNYKISNAEYLIKEPPYYKNLFDILN
jgi:hypothetical protein